MAHLTLEHFTSGASDPEAAYYRILGALKTIHNEFVHNRLYPPLAELIELRSTLLAVRTSGRTLDNNLPKRIVGLDVENGRIIYEQNSGRETTLALLLELIDEILPVIERTIEEGRTVYNFIDEHVQLVEVGLVPNYIAEGYALVPELAASAMHIYRYTVATLCESGEQYRSLRTTLVRTIPFSSVSVTPVSIKQELIASDPSLPNPATWCFEQELSFPYHESVLPVVRRRLIQRVSQP